MTTNPTVAQLEADGMEVWTIYKGPGSTFYARCGEREVIAANLHLLLDQLQTLEPDMIRIERHPSDARSIVEYWV